MGFFSKNTGVVAIFLRYRIFLIQGSILGLLPYRQVLYYRPPGKRLYTIARENILWITERDFSEQRYTIFSEILINNRNATSEYSSEHGLLGIKFVAKKIKNTFFSSTCGSFSISNCFTIFFKPANITWIIHSLKCSWLRNSQRKESSTNPST